MPILVHVLRDQHHIGAYDLQLHQLSWKQMLWQDQPAWRIPPSFQPGDFMLSHTILYGTTSERQQRSAAVVVPSICLLPGSARGPEVGSQ